MNDPHDMCSDGPEVFDAFLQDVTEELDGAAGVYVKLAKRYCEKYPALHPTTIAFTVNKLLAYRAMICMLSSSVVDHTASNKMINRAMDTLINDINKYASDKLHEIDE